MTSSSAVETGAWLRVRQPEASSVPSSTFSYIPAAEGESSFTSAIGIGSNCTAVTAQAAQKAAPIGKSRNERALALGLSTSAAKPVTDNANMIATAHQ